MEYRNRIESDPNIMLGKPRIKGSRLTVELVLQKISDGYDFSEIEEMYPGLEREDILACVGYAADILGTEVVIPSIS